MKTKKTEQRLEGWMTEAGGDKEGWLSEESGGIPKIAEALEKGEQDSK